MKKLLSFIGGMFLAGSACARLNPKTLQAIQNPFTGRQDFVTVVDTITIQGSGGTVISTNSAGIIISGGASPGTTFFVQVGPSSPPQTGSFNISSGTVTGQFQTQGDVNMGGYGNAFFGYPIKIQLPAISNGFTGVADFGFDGSGFQASSSGFNFFANNVDALDSIGGSDMTANIPFNVPDDSYDSSGWNGNVQVPTKNSIRDKIESLPLGVIIGSTVISGISGSVLFVDPSGNLAQDNPNFFWKNTTHQLGINTSTLSTQAKLTVNPNWVANPNSAMQINVASTTDYGLVIQAKSGQTNNIFEVQDNLSNYLSAIKSNGTFLTKGKIGVGLSQVPSFDVEIITNNSPSFHVKNTSSTGYSQFLWSNTTIDYMAQLFLNGGSQSDYGGNNSLNFLMRQAYPIVFFINNNSEVFRLSPTAQTGLLTCYGSTIIGLSVRGAASQSANLQEWQNSSSVALSSVSSNGSLYVGGSTFTANNATGQVGINTSVFISTANRFQVNTSTTIAVTDVGHIEIHQPAPPAVSSCGTSPSISGTDMVGIVTAGTLATSCTITFGNPWTNAPVCVGVGSSAALSLSVSTTKTSATVAGVTAGSSFFYICNGFQ